MSRIFKIGNVTNARKHGGSSKRAHRRDGEQDFSLPALLHNLTDFSLKPCQVVLDQMQLLDSQLLFKQQTPLARNIFGSNALRGKPLQHHQLGFRGKTLFSHFPKCSQARRCHCMRGGKPFS